MAEVFIREAKLLRPKQNRDGTYSEMLAYRASAWLETAQRMLQIAMTNRRGPDYERAVSDSVGNGSEFLGAG